MSVDPVLPDDPAALELRLDALGRALAAKESAAIAAAPLPAPIAHAVQRRAYFARVRVWAPRAVGIAAVVVIGMFIGRAMLPGPLPTAPGTGSHNPVTRLSTGESPRTADAIPPTVAALTTLNRGRSIDQLSLPMPGADGPSAPTPTFRLSDGWRGVDEPSPR